MYALLGNSDAHHEHENIAHIEPQLWLIDGLLQLSEITICRFFAMEKQGIIDCTESRGQNAALSSKK
jgi:hypothetical protein